jgi:hypothetical protein
MYLCHSTREFLTCQHGANSFTSSPKLGLLRIFIILKSPLPLAGFDPTNLGSSGKHANHYPTEMTHVDVEFVPFVSFNSGTYFLTIQYLILVSNCIVVVMVILDLYHSHVILCGAADL